MGDIEHIVCPDKLKGNSTETHSFFIVSPMGLYNLLLDLMKCTGGTKDAVSVLYNASKDKSASWKRLTPKARVYIRFQVGAYILCSASDLDLAENTNWKQLEKSLTRSLSESVKSDTGVHRALEILMDAARKISSSNSPLEKRTNPPQGSSALRGSNKRQRPSDLEEDVQRDAFSRLVRPRSGGDGSGDTSEQNAFDGGAFDGFPDSVLPQPTCQGIPAAEFLSGFNGILPRCSDNGVQHDASRQISTGRQQDKLCRLVRTCSSMLLQAHALGLLSIDKRAMLVHITHEGLKKDLKALCKRKNDEMQAATILSGMRGRK